MKSAISKFWRAVRERKLQIALSALSGLLLAGGLPTFNLWPLGFIALIPFLWALRQTSGSTSLGLGFLFGWVYAYASLFWLNSIWPFAPSRLLAAIGVMGLAAYCAIYYALFAWTVSKFRRLNPALAAVALASVWSLLEWMRSLGALAFPWAFLGHTQSSNLPFIQMADLGGVGLVSFVLFIINYLLMHLLFVRGCRSYAPSSLLLVAVILPYAYGAWRMNETWRDGEPIRVGISQPNVEQIVKFSSYAHPDRETREGLQSAIEQLQFDQVRAIHRKAPDTDLYLLPETSFTQPDFQVNETLKARIAALAREVNGAIFFGADNAETSEKRERVFVAAWLADPQRGIVPKAYNKMRLVPFGESLPYFEYIPYFQDKVLGMGTFDRGRDYVLFDLNGSLFGCGICFESASPQHMAKLVREGAQFLALITNDAWYFHRFWQLDGRGAPQHDALSTFRAIENRRYVARSANTGISRIIDPAGRTLAVAPREQQTFVTGTLYPRQGETFYTRFGDWFFVIFMLIAAASLWRARVQSGPAGCPVAVPER